MQNEFDKILSDHAVITNLNALEDLISAARTRQSQSTPDTQPSAPHTLPPATIIEAHLTPLLISQNSQLNARLQTVQSQNAGLMQEIRRQREEIEGLLKGVEGTMADLEGAGGVLGDDHGTERALAARGAEGVLIGVE